MQSDYCKRHRKKKTAIMLTGMTPSTLSHFYTTASPWIHVHMHICQHTSSSTSTRMYWRVRGWLSKWRMVVISASLMRLSWQSITLFRMVLRPPRLATTSGFFRAAEARCWWQTRNNSHMWPKLVKRPASWHLSCCTKWNSKLIPAKISFFFLLFYASLTFKLPIRFNNERMWCF